MQFTRANMYETGLGRTAANFQALTPLSFLERTAANYPDHSAVIHGALRRPYRDLYARSRQLAAVLKFFSIGPGDTVSAKLANTPEMLEAHFGVPMTGATLHTLNTRLDAAVFAFQLDHAESNKTRLVPLHDTTANGLQRYLSRRQPRSGDNAVFIGRSGHAMRYIAVKPTFDRLMSKAGIVTATRRRPRLHDLGSVEVGWRLCGRGLA